VSSNSEDRASELRDLFFQSAQELLQALNEQGLGLEGSPDDVEAVRSIRRTVHTLKGDAAACGFRQLSELAHELEDVLAPETGTNNGSGLAEVVLSAADMFDAMLAAYRAGLEPPNGDPLRAMIWKMARRSSSPKPAGDLKPDFCWSEYEQVSLAEAGARGLHVYNVGASVAADCPMRDAGLQLLKKVLQEAGTVLASAPEESRWATAEKLEFAIATDRDEQWLLAKCRIPGVVAQVLVEKFEASSDTEEAAEIEVPAPQSLQPVVPVASGGNGHLAKPASLAAAENVLRVEADRIDNLLNLVGELVIAKSMLYQTLNEFSRRFPKDPLRGKFADAMAFQSQVLNALQRSAMKIRMVPVEQLFRRFPRLVRDVAKLCGKNVKLDMSGQETDLDKGLLDALAEPLAHLLRNAIDHGIETAEERHAAGKPEQGTLRLNASHQGNQVLVEMADDGRGIDVPTVLAKATERGLITAEQAGHISEADALELIYEPGFSTAGHLTQISGRGMGMDVVRSAVQKLKGSVSVQTEAGRGTCIRLRLPLTLAIIRAMLFRVAQRLYAVPLDSVLEITRASEADIHRIEDREVLQLRNEVLTLVRLSRAAAGGVTAPGDKLFVLVIGSGERKFGLVVDKLVGEEELVIKPLDENIIASELVSGASILGDGAVVLILNVSEVVRQFANSPFSRGLLPPNGRQGALEARA
jgi:two-component system, chemotaxis family, sensor kinase CheA